MVRRTNDDLRRLRVDKSKEFTIEKFRGNRVEQWLWTIMAFKKLKK